MIALTTLILAGCTQEPATVEQLSASLKDCGIHSADIRIDSEGLPAWFWSPQDRVLDDDIDCVRERLKERGATAQFYDKTVTDGAL
ncbi:MAG: hypothetical protein U1D66_04855 [Erythrobacter sp.]|nr:hypothetical protein [Erythrobacter sp.]